MPSVVKTIYYSCRGPAFCSQHPAGGSQPAVIPAARIQLPLLTSEGTCKHIAKNVYEIKNSMNL